MKKIILFFSLLLAVVTLKAGDGGRYINISSGYQYKNTFNALIELEFERTYQDSWGFYVDLSTRYSKCFNCKKICAKSLFDYKTFGVGMNYKYPVARYKNSLMRLYVGADIGANDNSFQASADLGIEYTHTFANGVQFFVLQKNDFVFWSKHNFRNGLLVGFKIPIN